MGYANTRRKLKVTKMLVSYKTEIQPTDEQKQLIEKTIGVARFVKNFYIAHNQEIYKTNGQFVSGMSFSKWLNNEYIPNNPDKQWMKDVSSKSTKQAIMETEKAFKRFFKGQSGFPRFKKKKQQNVSMYFVKNDKKSIIACERHRIKIPTLGWVKLKEKGYIPRHDEFHIIKSGTITKKADRYYLSVLVEQDLTRQHPNTAPTDGIGIDLGIKTFATVSNDITYDNINKTKTIRKLEKQLKRQQRALSRKYESEKHNKNLNKGEATRKNINKQVLKVQKLHQRLTNIRNDRQNKIVSALVKTKPAYITIENLNVKGMIKNRHLAKAVSQQSFHAFRMKLKHACRKSNIELRLVDRFYPSSKLCHNCGHKKIDLKLSDRTYHCTCCHTKLDRDLNASLNLKDAKQYSILT